MHQITAYEFRVVQSDGASWIARPFPFGGKDGLPFVNRKYPTVGNGSLVRISSKIFNGVVGTVEGFLYIRTPVPAIKAITELRPVVRVTQPLTGGRESEFLAFVKRAEAREVFPFKLVAEYLDRDKKATGRFPCLMVCCQSSTRDDTVHMHAVINLLVPGVRDLNNTGCCTEMFLIRRWFEKRFSAASVKKPIEEFLVAVCQEIEFMWKYEYHMEIRGIYDLGPSSVYSYFLIDGLAVGAAVVPVGTVTEL